MQEITVDAALLKKCFLAAAANVERNKEAINELNVFPVPDGDTGTNVAMTLMSAVKEVEGAEENNEAILRAMSNGALKGARGNSGVIFSQLIRGFTKSLREEEEYSAEAFARAFKMATEIAYKAVMKPKEGTILTVAKGMSDKMQEIYDDGTGYNEILKNVIEHGDEVLDMTPEMLPVLKEAGVVDSGGMALMVALKGIAAVLDGTAEELLSQVVVPTGGGSGASEMTISTEDIKFGYCTECIINLNKNTQYSKVLELKEFLESIGDSVVCVEDEGIVKIHVHTNHPGLVFEKGLEMGSLSRLKVDNLHEEAEEKKAKAMAAKAKEMKASAVVAVCAGKGLAEVFRLLGADEVIEGGQTMNPSIQDILEACEKACAKRVYVLPNNKNIILASEQASKNTDGKFEIITIPSKTVLHGITAMMNYDPEGDAEANVETMKDSLSTVKSGEVTYAVRDTSVDGFKISKDDIMGIGDSGILAVGGSINKVTEEMIEKMADEDTSLITIYPGEDISDETAEELRAVIAEKYDMADVDVQRGDQPVYYYLVSVE
ncbi:MAG: DAK2 domain-containing protein [Eubacteriales bacterium]|nr:DAK2 domain-containing protein [Eubacteriales bacterium]